jgi:hypothetical protein
VETFVKHARGSVDHKVFAACLEVDILPAEQSEELRGGKFPEIA